MEIIETQQEIPKILLMLGFHTLNQLLRTDTFLLGAQHDRCAVGVVRPGPGAIMAAQPLETHPDISLNVFNHMAQVNRTIGIGQSAGYQYFAGNFRVCLGVIHNAWITI